MVLLTKTALGIGLFSLIYPMPEVIRALLLFIAAQK
jgi:hypothetical protein